MVPSHRQRHAAVSISDPSAMCGAHRRWVTSPFSVTTQERTIAERARSRDVDHGQGDDIFILG